MGSALIIEVVLKPSVNTEIPIEQRITNFIYLLNMIIINYSLKGIISSIVFIPIDTNILNQCNPTLSFVKLDKSGD